MKRYAFIIGMLLATTDAYAQSTRKESDWDKKLVPVANKEGVPAPLLSAICFVESSHKPHATHYDDGGSSSIGLCQIKMSTAKMLGYRGTVESLYNGKINAKWAAKYLKYQLDRYNNDWKKAAAAYNAGSVFTRDGDFVNQDYVDKVMGAVRQ